VTFGLDGSRDERESFLRTAQTRDVVRRQDPLAVPHHEQDPL